MKVIDSHSHVFFSSHLGVKPDPEGKRLIRELDACGIESAVVSAGDGICTTELGKQKQANDRLAELQEEYKNRLFCLATVNPLLGKEASSELGRCKKKLKLYGIKLHPWLQAFSVMYDNVQHTFKTASDLDMPILFHDGTPPYCTSMQIGHIAHKYPRLKIILGHGGLKDLWPDALKVAKANKNVYICTCGTPFLGIKVMIEELGPERVMFGSDSGFFEIAGTMYQLNNVKMQDILKSKLDLIVYKNVKKIFGLEI